MSDLAPFVAAALRDKVVKELMEENQAIRQQLQQARRVEITGPGGTPVHAQAQFDDDGSYSGNPNLWAVKLPEGKQLLPCPLSALEGIEIRVGGILKAKFAGNSDFQTFLNGHYADREMTKVATFCFGGASSLWFTIMIDGWPEYQWRETIREAIDADDLLRHLIRTVATESPAGKTVTFLGVGFMNEGVRGAIEALNLSPETQEDAEEARERQAFLIVIVERMRSAGNEEEAMVILDRASAIQLAFHRLGIYEPGEMFEQIVGHLIESQNLCPTPEDFEVIVNNMVSISKGTYQGVDDEAAEE
jgi:hypothetical protein